jgi:hypothetical protein
MPDACLLSPSCDCLRANVPCDDASQWDCLALESGTLLAQCMPQCP